MVGYLASPGIFPSIRLERMPARNPALGGEVDEQVEGEGDFGFWMLDFEWGEAREEETDMRFTMERTLTDHQAV